MATPTSLTAAEPRVGFLSGRAKLLLGLLAVAAIGVLVWLFLREAGKEERLEQWDVYGDLRSENEWEELFFEGEAPLYQAARDRYVRQLEAFVGTLGQKATDALEPQARWRIVKTEGESLLSMKDVLDVAQRLPHTERALAHLQAIQERFPDFPLNWGQGFAPEGFATTTRQLVSWFRENAAWDKEHLPKDLAPDPAVVVVLRTDRGDMRMGLYPADGPLVTARFLRLVQSGAYDGTAFVERVDQNFAGETQWTAVRAGDLRSRDAKAYDTQDALRYARPDEAEGFLPDENRYRIQHVRGVVTTWHSQGDEYDHPTQVLFIVRSSPGLNFVMTPIGRLLDEASLATLDRIQSAKSWRDDPVVSRDGGELRSLLDVFQTPARLVKALTYKDGRLWNGEVAAVPTKATADETEATLAALKPDAYKTDPPPPPAPPAAPVPAVPPPAPVEPRPPG